MSETRQQAERARRAFLKLSRGNDRTRILEELAQAIDRNQSSILAANEKDLAQSKDTLSAPLYKRLVLTEQKIEDVIKGIRQMATMPDPLGRVLAETELDDKLVLRKVQTPIGVIAAIFESRPDVTPQIAALAIRTGNAALLKGGREASSTNAAFVDVIRSILDPYGVADAIQLVPTRDAVAELLEMSDIISLIIPRGSNEMVRTIQQNTSIPVLGHADGICHVFVDEFADPAKAISVAVDSKTQYPAVCNAAETLLIHSRFACRDHLLKALTDAGVELRTGKDFGHEFLDLVMSVRIVDSIDDAIEHIHRFGSSHTDAIVTENEINAQRFLNEVDSAGVFWNASTRFSDGFRYGFGAEVGVSTNKTHARGPVGIEGLLIYKYHLIGDGHIVASYVGENARPFLHRAKPV